jgi:hypothetical protein
MHDESIKVKDIKHSPFESVDTAQVLLFALGNYFDFKGQIWNKYGFALGNIELSDFGNKNSSKLYPYDFSTFAQAVYK